MAELADLLKNLSARDVDALHRNADIDVSRRSIHHTLGPRGGQAAPGDHAHDGNSSVKLDIKNLTGKLKPSDLDGKVTLDLIDAKLPYAVAAGSVASPGGGGSSTPIFWDAAVTVTLPSGRFTVPPVVTAVSDAGTTGGVSAGCTVTAVSATQFTIRQSRVGSAPTGFTAHWHAVQMTPTLAAG